MTVLIAVDGPNPWDGPCPPDGVTTRFTGRVTVTGGTGPVTVALRWETTDDRAGKLEPLTFDDRIPQDLKWGLSQTYNPGGTYDEMIKLVVTAPVQATSAPLPYTITCS